MPHDDPVLPEHLANIWFEAAQLAARKMVDYGDASHYYLGSKGQFAEMYRKMPKVKREMWDGIKLEGESLREVLMDLMSHCALAIDCLERENFVTPPSPRAHRGTWVGESQRDWCCSCCPQRIFRPQVAHCDQCKAIRPDFWDAG